MTWMAPAATTRTKAIILFLLVPGIAMGATGILKGKRFGITDAVCPTLPLLPHHKVIAMGIKKPTVALGQMSQSLRLHRKLPKPLAAELWRERKRPPPGKRKSMHSPPLA